MQTIQEKQMAIVKTFEPINKNLDGSIKRINSMKNSTISVPTLNTLYKQTAKTTFEDFKVALTAMRKFNFYELEKFLNELLSTNKKNVQEITSALEAVKTKKMPQENMLNVYLDSVNNLSYVVKNTQQALSQELSDYEQLTKLKV